MTPSPFPLSRALLDAVLADRTTDRFVCRLVWSRLGYRPVSDADPETSPWRAGADTPPEWAEAFPEAPELIAERRASVRLTRSIPPESKQLLKSWLRFPGYRIGELHPRRTRRATAVSWLLADLVRRGDDLPDSGPLPELRDPPDPPATGHPGDPPVR